MKRAQNGFTMVEMLVALTIGLFLLGGLLTLVQDNKRTFMAQGDLSQLQDNERLAMTMMTDVIQATGYYPNPTINTAASAMPAVGALAQGQGMTGTFNAAAPGDTITSRYATASGDGILNCIGASNASGGTLNYANAFSVVINAAGVSQLVCTLNGIQYPLVSGVKKLTVIYGVNTLGGSNNVDTYMNAAQVAAGGFWNNVMSVQVTLDFVNPLYTAPGLGQLPTLSFQRNIAVMGTTGI
jgi:type IV pilus assembly protein PilW